MKGYKGLKEAWSRLYAMGRQNCVLPPIAPWECYLKYAKKKKKNAVTSTLLQALCTSKSGTVADSLETAQWKC